MNHDANDKQLRIIGSVQISVHVREMMELVNFPVLKRLAVQALLKCDFWNQFVGFSTRKHKQWSQSTHQQYLLFDTMTIKVQWYP